MIPVSAYVADRNLIVTGWPAVRIHLSRPWYRALRSFAISVARQTGVRYGQGRVLRFRDIIRQGEE